MLSYTLENVFMLTVFQLLVAGLILCSSSAILYLQKDVRKTLGLVSAGFFFYSLHFLLRAVFSYRNLSLSPGGVVPVPWELLVQALEKAALVLLGFSFFAVPMRKALGRGFWVAVAAAFLVLTATPYLVEAYWPAASSRVAASALVNGIWLAIVAAARLQREGRNRWLAGGSLCLLAAGQFLRAASRATDNATGLWTAENASLLVGLGLLALVVESRSAHLPMRFFLRLNLIFIAVASMLILIVAEMERREYLLIAQNNTAELSEYLRGHLIYSSSRGLEPGQILSSPEIVRKVTSDFARLPDLRRVRVSFQGWTMEMSIGDDWLVTQEVYPAARPARHTRSVADRARIATLAPVLIEKDGRVLGSIELDESLRTINSQIARHMRIIFLTFTAAVFVAAALFGVTVQYAHKTIQQQFEQLEKTNAQLIHVERLASVGQLAGGVAHEINNPAGIIVTTSDYLLRESEKRSLPESFREDLQTIRRQAWRVSEIVNGLLTFARPMKLNKQPIDINAVVNQSVSLLAPRFRSQGVQMEEKLTPNLPTICGDPDRLEQVLVNLLNNAADAMPNGGAISMETSACELQGKAWILVSVADSGTGIADEHLKSIFDPFFSTKPRGRGTGLGLSVSHGIIRDHGGRIEAESQVGLGTIFRVYLPVVRECIEEV